jgi:hypothetical protein
MTLKICFVTNHKPTDQFESSLSKMPKYLCVTDQVLPITQGNIMRADKDEKKYYFMVRVVTNNPFSTTTLYELVEIGHYAKLLWQDRDEVNTPASMLGSEIHLVTDPKEINYINNQSALE